MQILGLNFRDKINNIQFNKQVKPMSVQAFKAPPPPINNLNTDVFQKSTNLVNTKQVSFSGAEIFMTHKFETTFTKQFFKKLLREGLPDAYSEINLIPLEHIDELKQLKVLNKKSSVAIKALKPYKDSMFSIEKQVFLILENLAKKHPDLTLQELLKFKYVQAEKSLIKQQSNVLNKINMMARSLPKKEFHQMRELIQTSFNRIFEPNPLPEERFGRKDFLRKLKGMKLSNNDLKTKMLEVAEKLPQSGDSVNAFIVKYAQPYKIRTGKDGSQLKLRRDSEELGIRLLEESVGTDDHIYPKTRYYAEEQAKLNDDDYIGEIDDFRVTILTSKKINNKKNDTLIDDFSKKEEPKIAQYIQNHINRLIEIEEKWENTGKYDDAEKLADYILVLRDEFAKRSNLISIDIGDFEQKIPQLRQKAATQVEKKVAKRLKKTGHADNTHKNESDENSPIESFNKIKKRKRHKHTSRFEQ